MASISRGGRAVSPTTGVVVSSRSRSSSTSLAVASRRVRKGLIFPFITFLPNLLANRPLPRYRASRCVYSALYSIKEPAGTEAQTPWAQNASASANGHVPLQGLSVTNVLLASMVLAIWLYLLLGRGLFWLGRERDEETAAGQGVWPPVMAV